MPPACPFALSHRNDVCTWILGQFSPTELRRAVSLLRLLKGGLAVYSQDWALAQYAGQDDG